jgi:hypothetical protein
MRKYGCKQRQTGSKMTHLGDDRRCRLGELAAKALIE